MTDLLGERQALLCGRYPLVEREGVSCAPSGDHRERAPVRRALAEEDQEPRPGLGVAHRSEPEADELICLGRIGLHPERPGLPHDHPGGLAADPSEVVGLAASVLKQHDRSLVSLDGLISVVAGRMVVAELLEGPDAVTVGPGEFECLLVELDRLQQTGPLLRRDAGSQQSFKRLLPDRFPAHEVVGPCQIHVFSGRRGPVVVGDQLGELVHAFTCQLFDPRAVLRVCTGPPALRQAGVRDVPDQRVLERELHLAGDARGRAGEHQSSSLQAEERIRDGAVPDCPSHRLLPEHPPHDGGLLEDPLLLPRKGIDPGREERMDRVR